MAKAFVSQDALEKSILFRLFEYAQDEDVEIEAAQIKSALNEGVSLKRIEMSLLELGNRDLVSISIGGDYHQTSYTITRKGYMQVEEALKDPGSFTWQYAQHGDEFLLRQTVGSIPASDRFVNRNDNEPLLLKIEQCLDELSGTVIASNSLEEDFAEPKDAVLGEIDASKALIKREFFNLRKLADLLVPLLRKLVAKFGSAAIGKLASELIDALMKLH